LKLFSNIAQWEREGDTIVPTVFQQRDTDCSLCSRRSCGGAGGEGVKQRGYREGAGERRGGNACCKKP